MENILYENFNDKRNVSMWCHSSDDIKKLAYIVTASAKSVLLKLKSGLPKSVYQLNLYNDLLKKGLQLQIEESQLNYCVKGEPVREIITVNDVLILECFAENNLTEHHKKRIKFDLENNCHTTGLLINFAKQSPSQMIAIIDNISVFH